MKYMSIAKKLTAYKVQKKSNIEMSFLKQMSVKFQESFARKLATGDKSHFPYVQYQLKQLLFWVNIWCYAVPKIKDMPIRRTIILKNSLASQ